jgi:hypothetical protein
MAGQQRFALYIQQLALESLFEQDERDERPADVLPQPAVGNPSYSSWTATSFSVYTPFRGPTNA